MAVKFEEFRTLKTAEEIADAVWKQTVQWDDFAKDVVGKQFARAADSIGANIAEAFGRFHYGERLQFLYYARGSLFETKYWLNRAIARQLLNQSLAQDFAKQLAELARQLNAFAAHVKGLRNADVKQSKTLRETAVQYSLDGSEDFPAINLLFTAEEILWLESQ